MRITVKNTNRDLVFFPDTKIRIQENNPMFHELGSYSFPFDIPLEENNRALDYPARLTKQGQKTLEYDVLIESKLISDRTGVLSIRTNGDKISASLLLGLGQFNYKAKNTQLRDVMDDIINIGDSTSDVTDHANTAITQNWPDTPYNFPVIYAPDFYDGNNTNFGGRINYFEPKMQPSSAIRDILPNFVSPIYIFTLTNFTCLIPFIYVSEIITRIVNYFDLKVVGDFINNDSIKRLMIWNNRPIDSMFDHLLICNTSSPVIINDCDAPNFESVVWFIINMSNVLTDEYDVWDGSKFKPKAPGRYDLYFNLNYTANTAIVAYLLYIFKSNGSYYEVDTITTDGNSTANITLTYTDDDFNNNRYYEIKTGTLVENWEDEPLATTPNELSVTLKSYPKYLLNQFSFDINLKNHVPDITVNEFISNIFKMFAAFSFNTGDNLEIFFAKDITSSSPVSDLTNNMLIGHSIEKPSYYGLFEFSDVVADPINDFELKQSVNTLSNLASEYLDDKLAFIRNINSYYVTSYDSSFNASFDYYTQKLHPYQIDVIGESLSLSASPAETIQDEINNQPSSAEPYISYYNLGPLPDKKSGILIKAPDKAYSHFFNCFNDMSFKVFNWLGLIEFIDPDDSTHVYPASSTSDVDNQGDIISSAQQLNWESLYNNYWSDFNNLLKNADSIKIDFDFVKSKLLSLKFYHKYLVNGQAVLISRKDFEFNIATDELIGATTLSLIKVNSDS